MVYSAWGAWYLDTFHVSPNVATMQKMLFSPPHLPSFILNISIKCYYMALSYANVEIVD